MDDDFELLFRAAYARLIAALTLLSGREAAEDAVQEAFVQALRHWPRIRLYDDPGAWVRRAALNRLANHRRGLGRRERALRRIEAAPSTDRVTDDAGLIDMRAALADLPERDRTVVVLHHVADVAVAEVAADLDLPVGTVKSILSRSRDRLRSALTDPADQEAQRGATTPKEIS